MAVSLAWLLSIVAIVPNGIVPFDPLVLALLVSAILRRLMVDDRLTRDSTGSIERVKEPI